MRFDDPPEPPLDPPDPGPELRWTDWSVAATVSVNARTVEEAEQRVAYTLRRVNEYLQGTIVRSDVDGLILPGSIVQRVDDRLPEES